jgi:prepilin-type N-terminal cleavage/methylation domain-containing protein
MKLSNRARQSGYSLVEVSITLLLILILAAIAIPNTATAIANIKLRGAASDFAGLVQKARITAVQGNKTYTILFGLPNANGAYIDLNGNSSFDSTLSTPIAGLSSEPMIQFGGTANNVAAPGGVGGAPTNLDASGGPLGWTATAGNISFNSRGLPCNSSATPCGSNVNYIFYFEDTRYFGSNGWAAVSVTAAARAKVWVWNGYSWTN